MLRVIGRGVIRARAPQGIIGDLKAFNNKGISMRFYSDVPMDSYELKIFDILKQEFSPENLEVKDVSGGCGSMFAISIESEKFKGIPMIKQHRLVNEVLKDEIAQWHGLQLQTKAVKK